MGEGATPKGDRVLRETLKHRLPFTISGIGRLVSG